MALPGWPLAFLALIATLGTAQLRVIDPPEPLPTNPPIQRPAPRRHIVLSPEQVLSQLTSTEPTRINEALAALDLSPLLNEPIRSATLSAVNLDADPRLERVLTLQTSRHTAALVFQQNGSPWWQLGTFLSGGPTNQPQDPFLELRETVWPGTKDLILHSGGSQGTGAGEVRLSILRLLRGHLYEVLNLTESAYNWTSSESSQFTYPNLSSRATPPRLLVRTQKRAHGRTSTTRQTYRWDAKRFAFLPASP